MRIPYSDDTVMETSDGVSVTKEVKEGEFSFPTVEYQISSDRDDVVTVRLVQSVPDEIDPEDFGFHPAHGSEHWRFDGDELLFKRTLEPEGRYTTICGVRSTSEATAISLVEQPMNIQVTPPDDSAETSEETDISADFLEPASEDRTVREAISTVLDENPIAGPSVSPASEKRTTVSTENEADVFTRSAGTQSSTPETQQAEESDQQPDAVDIVSAIQRGDVQDEDLDILREIFETEVRGAESFEARIRYLQTEVADLQAYTSALEEFLDENGSGDQIIERLDGQIQSVLENVSKVEDILDTHDEELSSLYGEAGELYESVDGISDEVDSIEADLRSVESTVEDLEHRLTDGEFSNRLSTLEEEMAEIREWKQNMRDIFA